MKKLSGLLTLSALAIGLTTGIAAADGLKDAKDVHVAFITHGQASDAYWSVVKRGVDDGQKLTGAEVTYNAPETFDVVQMARLIKAAIASKVDGIVVSIPDETALTEPIKAALAAGIPVMGIDAGEEAAERMGVDLFVGTESSYGSGLMAGKRLAKDGVLNVICINHEVGNVSLDERCRGINDGLADAGGGTEVVTVTQEPSEIKRRAEAYLTAHPDVQGVFAMGPAGADPLIQLFEERELFDKFKLYSFDVSPAILDAVAAGKMGFGMDAQQYLMGFLPVIFVVENATHGFWPTNDVRTGPLFIDTPAKAIAMVDLAKQGIR